MSERVQSSPDDSHLFNALWQGVIALLGAAASTIYYLFSLGQKNAKEDRERILTELHELKTKSERLDKENEALAKENIRMQVQLKLSGDEGSHSQD
jgi:hypothetical protein